MSQNDITQSQLNSIINGVRMPVTVYGFPSVRPKTEDEEKVIKYFINSLFSSGYRIVERKKQ